MTDASDPVVVGFDLGHGETALALTHARKTTAPTVLELTGASGNGRQHITAVGEHPDRGVLLGEEAVEARGVTSLFLAFKSPQIERDAVRRPVQLLVGGIRDDVTGRGLVPPNGAVRWTFGAPSGWSAELRTAYGELLRSAGLARVDVVPESRAALLYARESGEVTLDPDQLHGGVLIVDVGSSTTDITFVDGLRMRPVDRGSQLGAGLIDKTILRRAIDEHPQRAEVQELLHEDRFERLRLELHCRQVKEAFFRVDPGRWAANPHETVIRTRSIVGRRGKIYFNVELSAADMAEVLATPQPSLGGQSWVDSFRGDLLAVAEEIGRPPDLVLLTGGASRMHFVLEVSRELFGADRVRMGTEPEVAIARGLALAGQMSVRAAGFREDVHRLVRGDQIKLLVSDRLPAFAQKLGDAAAAGMTERYVIPAFRQWRAGTITTLNDLTSQIITAMRTDLTDPANPRLARASAEWQNELHPELEELTRPICNRWQLPPAAMRLPPVTVQGGGGKLTIGTNLGAATEVLDNVATAITVVVAGVVAVTLFGAGTALIATTGPIGVVVAFIAIVSGLSMGKDAAMEKAMKANLPLRLRQMRTEAKLVEKLREGATAEEAALSAKLSAQFLADGGAQLVSEITAGIAKELEALAIEAELLIA